MAKLPGPGRQPNKSFLAQVFLWISAKKVQKHAPIMKSPTRNPNFKKIFFQSELEDFLNP